MLITNRKPVRAPTRIIDIAPTVLNISVSTSADIDGKPIFATWISAHAVPFALLV